MPKFCFEPYSFVVGKPQPATIYTHRYDTNTILYDTI